MNVVLYRVGRNLNRCYRTAEAFGVEAIELLMCSGQITGNLFKAKGRVSVFSIDDWPPAEGMIALETHYKKPLSGVEWGSIRRILIGGETTGLPRDIQAEKRARIPMFGQVSGLTVEAALAIALYEWRRGTP